MDRLDAALINIPPENLIGVAVLKMLVRVINFFDRSVVHETSQNSFVILHEMPDYTLKIYFEFLYVSARWIYSVADEESDYRQIVECGSIVLEDVRKLMDFVANKFHPPKRNWFF